MGLPAKVLADDETALVVLRPHVRRLVRPALVLLLLAPAAGYALGAVPAGATQATIRAVVGAVAAIVALRWVIWPFATWWTTLYVLTDQRLLERVGVVGRSGHDLPLRGITDVVVAQRLGERLLRTGTLSVTTEGGAKFTMTDVPGVSRLQHGLLAVPTTSRSASPRRPGDSGGRTGGWTTAPTRNSAAVPGDRCRDGRDAASGDHLGDDPGDDPGDDLDDAAERERETVRRLHALHQQVRMTPVPDSPVEDDATPPAGPSGGKPSGGKPPDRPEGISPERNSPTRSRPKGRASCPSRSARDRSRSRCGRGQAGRRGRAGAAAARGTAPLAPS